MKRPARASRSGYLICPVCEAGRLDLFGGGYARCGRCGYVLGTAMLVPLEQLVTLPDALGKHACECGHPEMRLLPDGVYHCPACGSEVLALEIPLDPQRTRPEWASGRVAEPHPDAQTPSGV